MGISDQQSGYLHAIEGVLAAIVVGFYMTSLLSTPAPTDWSPVHVSKQSEDVMNVIDRSGILEDAIARNDKATLKAALNSMDSSLGYTFRTQDIPQSHLDIGVLVNDTEKYTFSSSGAGGGGGGGGASTLVHRVQTQTDWNTGMFSGTSVDRRDNSGVLGIGYSNGTGAGGGGAGASMQKRTTATQVAWHAGLLHGTSPDRPDTTGMIGTGYLNGTPMYNVSRADLGGYWKLDGTSGNIDDASTNGNDGTTSGGTVRGDRGAVRNGTTFDGLDDHIDVSGDQSLAVGPNATFSFWIKRYGNGTPGDVDTILSMDDNYWLHIDRDPEGQINFESAGSGGVWGPDATATQSIPNNDWTHVAAVRENNSFITFYVDGEFAGRDTTYTSNLESNPLRIGEWVYGSHNLNASLDEIRIYNRTLSEYEIKQLHNSVSPGLEGYWRMDHDASDTFDDNSIASVWRTIDHASGTSHFREENQQFNISANPQDAWTGVDRYAAAYRDDVDGDFTATVTITNHNFTGTYDEGGIVVRNDMTANGSSTGYAQISLTNGNGVSFQYDSDGDGHLDVANHNGCSSTTPIQLRLNRSGNTFTGQCSTTGGSTWEIHDTVTLSGAATPDAEQDVGIWKQGEDPRSFITFDDWNLQGPVRDDAWGKYDGIARNFDGDERGARGVMGTNAFHFDGSSADWVRVPGRSDLNLDRLTLSAWINPDVIGSSKVRRVFQRRSGTYGMYQRNGDIVFYVDTSDDGGTWDATAYPLPAVNQWYHVVGTYNGSEMRLYVDGTLQDTNSQSGDVDDPGISDFDAGIGGDPGSGSQFYNGSIDEVRLFDGAMSEDEVEQLYFNGQSGTFNGDFTGRKIDTDSIQSWNRLEGDLSGLPSDTSVDANVSALDATGSVIDTQIITGLAPGENNYTLAISDSEDARVSFYGSSTNASQSWTIDDYTVYHSTGGGGGGSSSGLVGHWRMDALSNPLPGTVDVKDYSGVDNHGVNYGAGRGASGAFSTPTFQFDGSSWVNVSDDDTLDTPTGMTVSHWVRPAVAHETPPNNGTVAKAEDSRKWSWQVRYGNPSFGDRLGFQINESGTYTSKWVSSGQDLTPGNWYHVVARFNGTHISMFVDGTETDSQPANGIASTDASFLIGQEGWENTFTGEIDEVRLYDRGLSDTEIRQLYFQGVSAPFTGNYTGSKIDTGTTQAWQDMEIDATIPANTDAKATFQALDASGNPVDQETFVLSGGGPTNYSLSGAGISDSEDARFNISGTSTDADVSWEINEVHVYYENAGGGGGGGGPAPCNGLPASEHEYMSEKMNSAPGFGNNDFYLSDTNFDGKRVYNTVNFDFGPPNGQCDEPGEGPFNAGEIVLCDGVGANCNGDDEYTVLFNNDTLVLLDFTLTRELSHRLRNSVIDGREVTLDFETTNVSDGDITRFDAVVAPWELSMLQDRKSSVAEFLAADRFFLLITDTVPNDVNSTFLGDLGFRYEDRFAIIGGGPTTNLLHSVHGSGNASYELSNYYLTSPLQIGDMRDFGSYREGRITVREKPARVRIYADGNVAFNTSGYVVNHTVGDLINLNANNYLIQSAEPFRLDPVAPQRFSSFDTMGVTGDHYATKAEYYRYNTSLYDERKNYSNEYENQQGSWGDVVSSPCNTTEQPYRTGQFDVGNTDFLMINFDEEGLKGNPCSNYYEYVYFDKNSDTDFEDGDEGPYQIGDTVELNGLKYTVDPFITGNGTEIRKTGPRTVGEIPISRRAVNGTGRVAIMNRTNLGDDDYSMVKTLLLSETDQEFWLTAPQAVGDTSFSYTYTGRIGDDAPEYYTLNTVWWYK